MLIYSSAGLGTTWTPVGSGAKAETMVQLSGPDGSAYAKVPVQAETMNEVTKAGIARTVIKVSTRLNANVMNGVLESTGSLNLTSPQSSTTPVEVHLVMSAPRGVMQSTPSTGGLNDLLIWMLDQLLPMVREHSRNKPMTSANQYGHLLDALRGKQAIDVQTGVYGDATA